MIAPQCSECDEARETLGAMRVAALVVVLAVVAGCGIAVAIAMKFGAGR